jgi:hypothetical protein
MMKRAAKILPGWIASPSTDLIYFGFGWVPIFALFVLLERLGLRDTGWQPLLVFVLFVNFLHRHLTLPLVYADPEQFDRRRSAYILLPILCLVFTVATVSYVQPGRFVSRPLAGSPTLRSGDHLVFQYRKGHEPRYLEIGFNGLQPNYSAVAEHLQQGLAGIAAARFQDGRLEISLLGTHPEESLRLSRVYSNLETAPRLGLEASVGTTVRPGRPWFSILLFLSVAWTIYHTVMQKMGILRVYSRKAGYGVAWLDKGILYAWFVYLFFQLASLPKVQSRAAELSEAGKILNSLLTPVAPVLPYLAGISLLAALAVTALYLGNEWRQVGRFHWPKNLFVLSTLLLYATFAYDFMVGYAVFAFSHAIEYLAFVNLFSRRKYLTRAEDSSPLAHWVRRQAWYFGAFTLGIAAIFLPWRLLSDATLTWYIVGSSFLHFLYDGWIWKVRDPQVARPLGIAVESAAAAEVA